jgi:hypothetical protein
MYRVFKGGKAFLSKAFCCCWLRRRWRALLLASPLATVAELNEVSSAPTESTVTAVSTTVVTGMASRCLRLPSASNGRARTMVWQPPHLATSTAKPKKHSASLGVCWLLKVSVSKPSLPWRPSPKVNRNPSVVTNAE